MRATLFRTANRPLVAAAVALCLTIWAVPGCEADRESQLEGGLLDSPLSVAYADGYVYVSNANYDLSGAGEGFLTVIDAAQAIAAGTHEERNRAIIGKQATNPFIAGLAVDEASGLVYVADRYENEVIAFDVSNPTDPQLVDMRDDIDGIQGLRTGDEPYDVMLREDGRYMYATNISTGDVSVIDLAARRLARSIPLASGLNSIARQPETDYAWVTNKRLNVVSLIDTTTNDFVVSFAPTLEDQAVLTDTRGIAFTPDGAKAYIAINSPPMVAVVDTSLLPDDPSEAVRGYVPMDSGPMGLAVTPDGSECWATNFDSKRILVIDTQFDQVTDLIRLGTGPTEMAIVQLPEDDPEQFYVFTTHFHSHSMSIIDGVTKQNLGKIK